jgi:hypothetical protein
VDGVTHKMEVRRDREVCVYQQLQQTTNSNDTIHTLRSIIIIIRHPSYNTKTPRKKNNTLARARAGYAHDRGKQHRAEDGQAKGILRWQHKWQRAMDLIRKSDFNSSHHTSSAVQWRRRTR